MKKLLSPKLLLTIIATSSLLVAIPLTNTSCSKTEPFVEKIVPMSFYDIDGTTINGWTQDTLNNPNSLNGYNTMKFDSGYTLGWNAFSGIDDGGGDIDSEKLHKINICLSYFTSINLTGVSYEVNSLSENATFAYAAFSALTSLTLPSTLGSYIFYNATISPLLVTLNIPYSSPTDIPTYCFFNTDWNPGTRNTNITIHIPTSATPLDWTTWASDRFGTYGTVNNDLS